MKIKLFRSATLGIIDKNYKLLTDPWLTDGEYYGSWFHYPYYDLDKKINEINSYNGIYISHIHPDHASDKTLKKINKSIPIYIHKYQSTFLKFKLENLGFHVIEIENGKSFKLTDELSITIYAADNCNPELCYKFMGCGNFFQKSGSQQIDSMAIIKNKDFTILNTNDCPFELSKDVLKIIKKKFNKIDVLLTGYSGAGPYPQCIENFDKQQKKIEAEKKKLNFLNKSFEFIKYIKPTYYLPFAGTYTLNGKLSKLQNFRGVPSIDEAYNYIDKKIKEDVNLKFIKSLKINPDNTFDLKKNKLELPYVEFNKLKQQKYILKKLSKNKLSYEKKEKIKFNEIFDLARLAHKRYLNKLKDFNIEINTDIVLDVLDKYIIISNKKKKLLSIEKKKFSIKKNYVIYRLDIRLLKKILQGPKYAHWNNAEIGSHITFYREPNIYDRKLYFSMNFFHS